MIAFLQLDIRLVSSKIPQRLDSKPSCLRWLLFIQRDNVHPPLPTKPIEIEASIALLTQRVISRGHGFISSRRTESPLYVCLSRSVHPLGAGCDLAKLSKHRPLLRGSSSSVCPSSRSPFVLLYKTGAILEWLLSLDMPT